jgi:murein DD-endopeptidase MepM/ murein hydrolase activator NlpD
MPRPRANFGHESDESIRLPPKGHRRGKIAALCTIVLLSAWAGGATLYVLFRDDALKLIVARQISVTRGYEAQVTALQGEIDRLHSLKLIDQERVDRAVSELLRRQTLLEARQSTLSTIVGNSEETTSSLPPRAPDPAAAQGKPAPLSETIMLAPATERWSHLESRPLPPLGRRVEIVKDASATEVRIANLARELEQMESAQGSMLNAVEEHYDRRDRRMRRAFADLGLRSTPGGAIPGSVGGPFLPWRRHPEDAFMSQAERVRATARSVETLEREIATVPVRRPTSGDADMTSPFGVRLDPFVRQLAMHTGVDFRGEPGEAVHAAAAGKITQAERNGGYGLMVEIDHGNGLVTRYAHLAAAAVEPGAGVKAGELIGRIGSSGRSTGPHLHYEVRFNGEAVDPQKFLRAGVRMRAQN